MALAALSAAWVVHSELKRYGYNPELASTMVFAAAVGGLVGARLLFIVEEWNNFLIAPLNYILTGAGFHLVRRVFGGVAAVSWVVKKNIFMACRRHIVAPALALAYGVGRIGCHVAGDGDWGIITKCALGRRLYERDCRVGRSNNRCALSAGVRVHPTPDLRIY